MKTSKVPLPPVILNYVFKFILNVRYTVLHNALDTPMYWSLALTCKQFLHALLLYPHAIIPVGIMRVTTYAWEQRLREYTSEKDTARMCFIKVKNAWVLHALADPKRMLGEQFSGLLCFNCNAPSMRDRPFDTPDFNISGNPTTQKLHPSILVHFYASYSEKEHQYTDILCYYCTMVLWYTKYKRLRRVIKFY